jgi:FMN phosphatase YigB (HAD superfamily)
MTNEDRFWQKFAQLIHPDARRDEPYFDEFYRNEFQFVALSCGKDARAAETIRYLKAQGCRLVLATNPIFPAVGTRSRMRWAGLTESDFELVTTYENSRHCKPNPAYYQDILDTIGEQAENCIMVGNDVTEDMVAKTLGMEVFLVTDCLINKENQDISQYPNGSFPQLLQWLKEHI